MVLPGKTHRDALTSAWLPLALACIASIALHALALQWWGAKGPAKSNARWLQNMPNPMGLRFEVIQAPSPVASNPVPLASGQANDTPPPMVDPPASPVAPSPASVTPEAASVASYYFASEELTQKPEFVREIATLPATFLPDVVPAPTLAHVFIGETGNVEQVLLEESFLSEVAKQYVQDYFRNMVFSPGRMGDLPVKSRIRVIVRLNATLPLH